MINKPAGALRQVLLAIPIMQICVLTSLFYSCSPGSQKTQENSEYQSGWQLVYQHDKQGNPLQGSREALLEGFRSGYAVEIGWGWEGQVADSTVRIEHRASPVFLSLIQEQVVSAIIHGHPMLSSYIDAEQQRFAETGTFWQAVLTTQGTFNAQLRDASGELIKEWPQRHKISWFVEYPPHSHKHSSPLY